MKLERDSLLTATLVVCALITTGLVVRRELFAPRPVFAESAAAKPILVQDWRSYLGDGVLLGPSAAPVKLLEFADFECPFCGDFQKRLRILRERYPTQVALIYIHLPLPMHRFALPAARVAECAGSQGRFEAMYEQLFDGQEQFGLKPWREYAVAAQVPNLEAFDDCTKKTDSIARVEAGKQLGAKLDIRATPTVIINGWKLGRPPSEQELDTMVKAVLAGKSPVDGKS